MNFAVLGIGKAGQAMTAHLMQLGHRVTMWDRKQEKADVIAAQGIQITGILEGHFTPEATTSIKDAISDAQYILVTTHAAGHKPVAERLCGHLKANQRIVIFNGNWGAIEFHSILQDELFEKNILLTETGGMILLADSPQTGTSHLRKIKNSMTIAGIPTAGAATVATELHDVFPGLVAAANVLETSINNANPILHAIISLFNISRMENGEQYRFYADAASKSVLDFVAAADAERVCIAQAIGVQGEPVVDILNSFWSDQHDNLFDVIKKNDNYMRSKGPTSMDYRYLTEDVPFGLAPLVLLGRRYQVSIPHLEAVVNLFSLLLKQDFINLAPDLSRLNPAEII